MYLEYVGRTEGAGQTRRELGRQVYNLCIRSSMYRDSRRALVQIINNPIALILTVFAKCCKLHGLAGVQ